MSGFVDALAILAVVVLVIARRFRTRRIEADRCWWVLPAVPACPALREPGLREPGLLGPGHRTASALLLGAELLVALATGLGRAWTTRVRTTPDGAVWSRGSRAGALVWTADLALRGAPAVLGAASGLHQGTRAGSSGSP